MIYFFRNKHAWLSNFADVPIKDKYFTYKSVENAYMAFKQKDMKWKEFCRDNSASVVKRESKKILIREDWDDIKLKVMKFCLDQKFRQEPFRTKLIETGDQNIIEGNYWKDTYWGVDLKQNPNIGENHLGRIIMEIRKEIKQEENGEN